MGFMLAEKQNYEICEAIIQMLHKKEISVEQSYAILDYVKRKIAQDTKVGELVKISYEDFLQLQKQPGMKLQTISLVISIIALVLAIAKAAG